MDKKRKQGQDKKRKQVFWMGEKYNVCISNILAKCFFQKIFYLKETQEYKIAEKKELKNKIIGRDLNKKSYLLYFLCPINY